MHRDVHFDSDPHAIVIRLALSEGPAPDRVIVDDTHFLFTAHFKKSGPDLILADDSGKKVVLVDYFNLEKRPDLVSPDGAILSADLVGRLAGPDAPGQYAQSGAPAGSLVIGRIEVMSGSATVQHANGVVDNLKVGDALLQGDVVMTGDASGLALSLNDGTAFNMGAGARMVLTELAYDSNSTSNSALINLVKGTFTFVAGQVAHTGDMKVATPVATMGIRGTTVGAYLDADVNGNVYQFTATLLDDPGGGSGRYDVLDPVTGAVLHTVRSTATQVAFTRSPNNQMLVQEASKSPAIVQQELAAVQILFPIFLANPANVPGGQPTQQPPNNSLTPPQDLPQPPHGTDLSTSLQIGAIVPTGVTADKVTQATLGNLLITTDVNNGGTSTGLAIAIAPIGANNIINAQQAQTGFAISGSATGADGRAVTVTIVDGSGNVVDSYNATAAGGTWSVNVTGAQATTLADGSYRVTASVSGAAGSAATATQTLTVDETAPAAPGVALATDSGGSNTDHITNAGTLTLSGIEAGTIVAYSIDGGRTWSSSFTAVEGANTVQVRQTDAAGNVSGTTTFSFTLDTIAPAAPGVALTTDSGSSGTDHITNTGALTLSGIETGAIVEYSVNNGQTWTSSFTAVEGLNTIQVRQTDVAGNVSGATSFSFTVRTAGPAAPGVALATDSGSSGTDHITNTGALTLSGIETGAIVQYSVNNGQTWTSSFTAVEGLNTIQVRQTDVAGNVSGATSFSFTLDTAAPAAPGVALATDSGGSGTDHITNTGALTLSGIETGAIVEYSVNNGQTWTSSFTAVEGLNTIQVRQTDVAGNVSSATSFSFTLDTAAPAAPGVALATDSGGSGTDHITNTGALTLSGIEPGAIVQYSVNNGQTWTSSFTAVEGLNTIQVRQTDVAGNVSGATSFSFTLDTGAPAAPGVALATDSGSSGTDHITNTGALTLSGIETGAIVQYSVNNGQTWTNAFTAVEGINTVAVRQTDVAGNVSTATSFSFTLDTTAPAAPGVALATDSGSSGTDHITNTGALTLSGIETGALVQYSVNNGQTWTNSFTAVEGINTVAVRQTDVAGNVSSATSFSFTLDTLAPMIAIATIAGDNSINLAEAQAGFAIGGSATGADGQTVTVTIVDGSGHVVDSYTTTAAGGTWSVNVTSAQATALADGSYLVTASVSDAAGNPATATQTLTVDEETETDTWVNASNGDWSAASHWSIGVPTTNTDVVIGTPGTYTISISQPAVAGTLTIDDIGATVKDNVSLVLSGSLKVNSGTFDLNNGSLQTTLISIGLAGIFLVEHGTHALSAPIANDGQFVVEGNGTLVDITGALSGLGSYTVDVGATLQFGTGWHTISGPVADNGTVEVTDGTLEIAGACSGNGTFEIDAGATLQLDGADALNVAFAGSTGTLALKDPASFTGTIAGLTGTDTIDLANIDWATAQLGRVTYNASTNITTLVITDGQHTDTIQLIGDYTSSTWTFSSDGSGGTLVVDPVTSIAALDASEDVVAVAASGSSSDSTDSYSPTSNDDTLIGASDITASSTWASDLLSAEFGFGADLIRFGSKSTGYFARLDAGHDSWLSQPEWQALLETPAAFNGQSASPWLLASAPTMQASNFAAPGADLMNDYFQFVDTSAGNSHSDPPAIDFPNQAASHGPFDASPGAPNSHADGPPIWAHDAFDREASPVSQSLQFADVNAGNGRSDSHHDTSQAASYGPEEGPATTPNNHADGRSQSPAALDMPSDHAASPAWKLFQSVDGNAGNGPLDPQHIALPGQAMLHIPAGTSAAGPNNHADGLSHGSSALLPIGNMTSDAMSDHFHFADLSAGNGIPQGPATYHPAFDLQQTALQEIIDAAAPANHAAPAAPIEAVTFTSVDQAQLQAYQGAIHSHAGIA